jgi:hypothetical protein
MTDWTAQTQQSVEQWMQAQQAWWREVLGGGSAPAQPAGAGGADPARQAVDAWRASAYRVVDAQAELLLATLHGHREAEAESVLRRWTDAQRALWQDWLATAGGDPATAGPDGQSEAGREMVESLRAAAEHLVRSQAEWAKAWTQAQPGDRDAAP